MDINKNKPLEFGLYSLGDHILNPLDGKRISQEQRIKEIIKLAMKVIRYGEEYSGTYELNDKNELIMTVDDKDKNTVDFAIRSFEPHEKNNDVYIGTVAKSDVPEGHALTNEFYSFSIEEPIGLQKIDD